VGIEVDEKHKYAVEGTVHAEAPGRESHSRGAEKLRQNTKLMIALR
jgi:hypothetical protein